MPSFVFVSCMVYRTPATDHFLLVIPKADGLHQFLPQELHNSAYHCHLGVRKTISALQSHVWWPKLPVDVKRFVSGCEVC